MANVMKCLLSMYVPISCLFNSLALNGLFCSHTTGTMRLSPGSISDTNERTFFSKHFDECWLGFELRHVRMEGKSAIEITFLMLLTYLLLQLISHKIIITHTIFFITKVSSIISSFRIPRAHNGVYTCSSLGNKLVPLIVHNHNIKLVIVLHSWYKVATSRWSDVIWYILTIKHRYQSERSYMIKRYWISINGCVLCE